MLTHAFGVIPAGREMGGRLSAETLLVDKFVFLYRGRQNRYETYNVGNRTCDGDEVL